MSVKKKTKKRLVALVLLLTLIIYGLSQIEIRKTLRIPYSQSIQDSKDKGAFLWSYKCPREVKVSDSITLAFREAFAEYLYSYKDYNCDELDICKGEMHVICFFDKEHSSKYARKNYAKTWIIEDVYDFDVPIYKMYLYRDSVVAPDTIKLHIYDVDSISVEKHLLKIIELKKE
jgi:hypothetical protein